MDSSVKITKLPYIDGPHCLVSGHAKRPAVREYVAGSWIEFSICGSKNFDDFNKFMRAYNSGCEITIYRMTLKFKNPKTLKGYSSENVYEYIAEKEIATVKKWGKNANPLTPQILARMGRKEDANAQEFK